MTKSYIKKVSFKLFLEGVEVRNEVDSKREDQRTRKLFLRTRCGVFVRRSCSY